MANDVTMLPFPNNPIVQGVGRVFTGGGSGRMLGTTAFNPTQQLTNIYSFASNPAAYYNVRMTLRLNWPTYYSA